MITLTQPNNKKILYMTRSFLIAIVLLIISLPYNVFAQNRNRPPTVGESERVARAATEGFNNLRPRITELGQEITKWEQQVETLQSNVDRLCGNLNELQCSLVLHDQMNSSDRATRERARRQHQTLTSLQRIRDLRKSELDELKRDYESTAAGLNGLSQARRRSEEQISPEVLQARIQSLDIKTDLLELTGETQNIDRVLDNISSVYDRSLLGAYVQDKITNLLTGTQPDLICQANNRCRGGRQGPSAVEVRNALFLESNRVRRSAPAAPTPRARSRNSGGTGLAD